MAHRATASHDSYIPKTTIYPAHRTKREPPEGRRRVASRGNYIPETTTPSTRRPADTPATSQHTTASYSSYIAEMTIYSGHRTERGRPQRRHTPAQGITTYRRNNNLSAPQQDKAGHDNNEAEAPHPSQPSGALTAHRPYVQGE
ncbi:hypothetical protein CERZMDRAFT_101760 [Cercospora zeae-maydis SCOH1-5]|uniref:Uncharacterized protein n=1 Tax=Cercospora zeae-maydis SCOH1-5 TaxID=717836 RepID=A0A6A6F3Q4_9PEZI|nr:hypothetical protein CERZMDRAFT_101760 [Cercospora zeae-maydis SCOH1-5]